ncbi:MAG: DUF4296 domain-containing protein [Flavobacteriaceae bacterium]|nr:DUF4296 domain-containing protein [Bacteroidia bacterium]NNK88723.1 DUF4296 domain-containing protein [Flavobacteriaceae bacterium]
MKTTLIFIVLAFALMGCKNNKIPEPSKPGNLLTEDQMVELIYDMAIMTAAKGSNRKILENSGIKPQSFVFEKHNVDSLQFTLSNEYYAYRIEDYERIYERVKTKLAADRKQFNEELKAASTKEDSIQAENKRRRDSIINARARDSKLDLQ